MYSNFHLKDHIFQFLTSGVIYKFKFNFGECVRHLVARSGEQIGIFNKSLINEREQPRKDSTDFHHILNCNYSPFFQDFSVL